MTDRIFFSLAAAAAVLVIALALVWPQGLGAPSPRPFRQPLGPVDPEIAAAARAQRKPVRPRYERPRAPGGAPDLRPAIEVPTPGGRP